MKLIFYNCALALFASFYEFSPKKKEIDVTVKSFCVEEVAQVTETEKEKNSSSENFTVFCNTPIYVSFHFCNSKNHCILNDKEVSELYCCSDLTFQPSVTWKKEETWLSTLICQSINLHFIPNSLTWEIYARIIAKILARNPKKNNHCMKVEIFKENSRSWQDQQHHRRLSKILGKKVKFPGTMPTQPSNSNSSKWQGPCSIYISKRWRRRWD